MIVVAVKTAKMVRRFDRVNAGHIDSAGVLAPEQAEREGIMTVRRHKDDTATYRELANYKERVQSFTMTVNRLCEYVRVQLELDASPRRPRRAIISARVRTLQRATDRLNRMG